MLYSKNKKRGFTLVELIVVLVILAILAALLIPALTGYIDKAKKDQVIAETRMLHEAIQTEMVEIYGSNIDWKTSSTTLGTGAHKTLANRNGNSCVGDSAVLPDAQQRYNEIVKLSEVSSLQDGTGHFYAFITSNAKIHALVYNSGRGYIGVYFRDTQQYDAYKIGEQTTGGAVQLDSLNNYIDSVYYDQHCDLDSPEVMWSCSGIRGMLNIENSIFNT